MADTGAPGLEYQHAFDMCAVGACQTRHSLAVVVSSPFYARDILRRLPVAQFQQVQMVLTGNARALAGSDTLLQAGARASSRVRIVPHLDSPVARVVWAEPEQRESEHISHALRSRLLPDGSLYIISSGALVRFLPEWHAAGPRPAQQPSGMVRTLRLLRRNHLAIRAVYGFHGPVSIGWGYSGRLLNRLRRSDLADRCQVAMRAAYVVQGWQAFFAPVCVIVAAQRRHTEKRAV
jgi:hypothetical protein